MRSTLDSLIPLTVPITATDRQQAKTFAQAHSNPQKAQQVFRNTLAVLATHRYLQMLAIAADPQAGWAWNRAGQLLDDAADLYLSEQQGYLECRPIRQGENKCWIPETVHNERLGYVVVQLDEPYREGRLLGCISHVSVTELPLSYLHPLDDLIDWIFSAPASAPATTIATLSQWLNRVFEPGWMPCQTGPNPVKQSALPSSAINFRAEQKIRAKQEIKAKQENKRTLVTREQVELLYKKQLGQAGFTIQTIAPDDAKEALLYLIQMTQDDEIRWQAAELLWEIDPTHATGAVKCVKDLGLYLAGRQVALMVGVIAKSDGKLLILTRVYPIEQELYLPQGLQITGFDETGESFFSVTARQCDDYIQFKFTADGGDRFNLQISFHGASVTESFIV